VILTHAAFRAKVHSMQTVASDSMLATPADHAACAMLLRGGSKTFQAASFALPAEIRRAATALYAFCRQADDAVDLGADGPAELARLHQRLDLIYAGRPLPIAADRAFAEVVAQRAIPRELPAALLEGFAWDLDGRRYATIAELDAYGARVAGTVGAMMAVIMGARDPAVLARACDLGVAMQVTNIARDVGEDARRGRLYLPRQWLAEEGIDAEAWLAQPAFTPAIGRVVERLLAHADVLYGRAAAGIAALPLGCRPAMHAARLLYREIGEEVRRRGLDSVSGRAVVSWSRKSRLLAAASVAATRRAGSMADEPLEATRFLVEAAAHAPPMPLLVATGDLAGAEGRIASLVDLFMRLEQEEQAAMRGRRRGDGLAAPSAQPG
jgi:phytoene synthase